MEFLLLLLIPVALGALFSGGGDDTDSAPNPNADRLDGTQGNDVLRGENTDEVINGDDGNDLIFGNRGDDTIFGGAGVDFVAGGLGDDVINGGANGDVLAGGVGNDSISGGAGRDFLAGGAGDDTLAGDADSDVMTGSTGSDVMYGGAGDDFVDGVSPTDTWMLSDADLRAEFTSAIRAAVGTAATPTDITRFLRDTESDAGDHGTDALFGGAGSDFMFGNDGDTMTGGADADYFDVSWVSGNAPVAITDYTNADERIAVYVDDDRTTVPEFGIRDAANGTGVELVLDDDVVAALANVRAADLNLDQIVMQLSSTGTVYTAIRLAA